MRRKFGKFFLLLSIFLIFLFVASDIGGKPDYTIILGGLFTMAFAFILLRRRHDTSEDSPRFRLVRKLVNRKGNDKIE